MIPTVPWTQAELDRRIDEVLVDAYGEGEELGAWAVALGDPIRRLHHYRRLTLASSLAPRRSPR
jgi:hypothetical protein